MQERSLSFSIRNALQEAQRSLNGLAQGLLHQIRRTSSANADQTVVVPEKQRFGDEDGNGVKQNMGNYRQLEAWRQNPAWTNQPPHIKVEATRGTLCRIESNFLLGMPPDELYNIVTDAENKRVFKNIKEVTYRKILEDEGPRQLVEVEQVAIWRFLCFSGTMSLRLFVDQNKHAHSLKFQLAKTGFMKKFEGSWNIKPVYIDMPHCELLASPEDEPLCSRSRIASKVQFEQLLQPIYVPPPPMSWYVRGISRRQTEALIEDLQSEAKRLREGDERMLESPQGKGEQTDTIHGTTQPAERLESDCSSSSRRRRRQNLAWRRK